jgi:hypothetical protein
MMVKTGACAGSELVVDRHDFLLLSIWWLPFQREVCSSHPFLYPLTTFWGFPARNARTLEIAISIRRRRADRVAQAMWGVI